MDFQYATSKIWKWPGLGRKDTHERESERERERERERLTQSCHINQSLCRFSRADLAQCGTQKLRP